MMSTATDHTFDPRYLYGKLAFWDGQYVCALQFSPLIEVSGLSEKEARLTRQNFPPHPDDSAYVAMNAATVFDYFPEKDWQELFPKLKYFLRRCISQTADDLVDRDDHQDWVMNQYFADLC